MSPPRITPLDPANYRRSPWKNGGGATIDIADAYRPGAPAGDWDAVIWRLGRTAITTPGPFSDLSGYDRLQVVVGGQGLVLDTPDGALDVRMPWRPVRFRGEPPIASRLEAGPVEVVNLIGARAAVAIDLHVLHADAAHALGAGTQVVYAPTGPAALICGDQPIALRTDHAVRLDLAIDLMITCVVGIVLVASIAPVC